ncbi:hypothetical protein ABZ894_14940 [Nocardia beijingensis]|uniref:hypothetical protein n=1 Tax=Nocardia beijingensis TaxID=95162 RepID=UPI0034115771
MRSDEYADISTIGGVWDPFPPCKHRSQPVTPERLVAYFPNRPWPYTPDTCQAGFLDTTWYLGRKLLLCNGCGLDAT